MRLVDFSNAIEIAPEYTGSEKKKTMILDNKKYLVKFPDPNRSTKLEISYINNVYSEYIGSKIFELCGLSGEARDEYYGCGPFNQRCRYR